MKTQVLNFFRKAISIIFDMEQYVNVKYVVIRKEVCIDISHTPTGESYP